MMDLKIVFMGTPVFALTSLDRIVSSRFRVVGVITAPDRPAGRGRKLSESPIKKYALKHNLRVLQPTNLKSPDFLDELKSLHANLFVVVAFRMLPRSVWEMPELGTFNLHASLLPQYRGAAPINWAVINGEKESGVTTFFINEKIDTGEIILQERTEIGELDTAGDLHDRLMELGADLVLKTIEHIAAGDVPTQIQKDSPDLKPAPKIHKETCKIDWNKSPESICNLIRGLSPYPGAWTHLINGGEYRDIKIYKASFEAAEHTHTTGSLLSTKKSLRVTVKGGLIAILEIQLPGKRKMPVQEVLNGLKLENDAHFS